MRGLSQAVPDHSLKRSRSRSAQRGNKALPVQDRSSSERLVRQWFEHCPMRNARDRAQANDAGDVEQQVREMVLPEVPRVCHKRASAYRPCGQPLKLELAQE